ncbi:MAG TPA: hypothetical protein VK727_04490 [Steroidobacteraceae bacterium]|nr:hypothetical protein [Steroidobacteraceae bacterium]
MDAHAIVRFSSPVRRMTGFARAVAHAVTWRAVALTQSLGLLYVLIRWLLALGPPARGYLSFLLVQEGASGLCVMLAALAGDEAVRRGWRVGRAFVAVTICASLVAALAQLGLDAALRITDPMAGLPRFVLTFFGVGTLWGTALMVYLNRQSARRILAGVRAGELARLRAEQQLIASRLAATETQVDPPAIRQRLERLRNLYATGSAGADAELERLITELRQRAARAVAAAEGQP